MKPYRNLSTCLRAVGCCLVFFMAFASAAVAADVHPPVLPNKDPVAKRGFDHFYNLEYDKAIKDFETLEKEHPDDPFIKNYLLSAVLFKEMYRIGALDSESYSSDGFLDAKAKRPLDPQARQRILDLINQTEQICTDRIQKNPKDVDAYYARGVARGMRSTFMGMGEKAWYAAVRSALASRHDHEKVLELDPKYTDAKMILGVHNYIVGSLNWAAKALVSLVGVSGSRQRGLDYLREVARSNGIASWDAKVALALFLRREQRYDEALGVVKSMADAYPRNFLVAIEYAHLLNASGHGPDAIAHYRTILENYKEGKYPLAEPEQAAYGLGLSLRGQRHFDEAAQAFDSVPEYKEVERGLARRALLASGEMYDTLSKRDIASKKYSQVISSDSGSPEADVARKHLRVPFHYP